jgi:cyclic pyranopterin phosphate synthase
MLRDTYNRPLHDLRISVTDRCNFRCTYCMPLDEYEWLEKSEVLSFEEITRLTRLFLSLGVEKIRLTGGEPLARRDLDKLIGKLTALDPSPEVCLTTNGSLLAEKIASLKSAGLRRLNVSIDSLQSERFQRITKRGALKKVLEGLFAAKRLGFLRVKINTVIERGVNDDEILGLVAFAREHEFSIRFIEFMDVGNANEWRLDKIVPKQEIIKTIHDRFPLREIGREKDSSPSVNYEFIDGCAGDVGVIASVTEPFCGSCTRARLTADGKLVTCLFAHTGYDLKKLMRDGATDTELLDVLHAIWGKRKDRYSEERLAALQSAVGYNPKRQKKIEMISLGG